MKTSTGASLISAALALPLLALAYLQLTADDDLSALSVSAEPILTTATARVAWPARARCLSLRRETRLNLT